MRRALPLLSMLALLGACASAPMPRQAWPPASTSSDEAQESAVSAVATPQELAARARLGPLAVSTFRFAAVQAVLRDRAPGQPMPTDAVRAWAGLFAAIDQALAGELFASNLDLRRAWAAAAGEQVLDAQSYASMPAGLTAAVRARIDALSARLQSQALAQPDPDDLLAWPVHPAALTSLFGLRLDPIDRRTWRRHDGIDIAARTGQAVRAAAAGLVISAGRHAGYGLLVAIRHPDGEQTRYGHLSRLRVHPGEHVERGQVIGRAGSTGRSTGPHVHFEVWQNGRPLDPLEALGDPDVPAYRVTAN